MERSIMARIPGYNLHKASGNAVVRINRRDIYLGKHGSSESKRKYNRLISEFLASGRSPAYGSQPADITIAEVCLAYMRYCRAFYGTASTSEYHKVKPAVRVLNKLYGDTQAEAFSTLQLKACRESLCEPYLPKKRRGKRDGKKRLRSRKYVNRLMWRIVRLFKWASSEGLVSHTIYAVLKTVEPMRLGKCNLPGLADIQPVDEKLVEKTIPHCIAVSPGLE
jgi:hypothetical protein